MAFNRPPSAFRNQLGGDEFPFETGRYILYVALGCPWANGVQQVAQLKGLVRPVDAEEDGSFPMQLAVLHPTWQYTDPEADATPAVAEATASQEPKRGMAAGVGDCEPHAGWVFCEPNQPILPLALMKNATQAFGVQLSGSAEDICSGKVELHSLQATDILSKHGVRSKYTTKDPSKHGVKTLRHLYEKCGGFMKNGVRATTPCVYDTKTDRIVSNESMDIAKYLNEWGEYLRSSRARELPGGEAIAKQPRADDCGPDLYPTELRLEIDRMIDWIYAINNGVYRCGFACTQSAYEDGAKELEARMLQVEAHLAGNGEAGSRKTFLVGERLTIVDIRLFNTLIRMDEVYVVYFKTYFASLFAPFARGKSRFPNLLRFTASLYKKYPIVRATIAMDDIRNHYFTSHDIRNVFAVVPREVGVLRELDVIAVAEETVDADVEHQ